MKDSLVIISACQYTQVALMHLLSEEKYHIRIFFNVNTEVESVLNSSCGYLLVDISSLFPWGESFIGLYTTSSKKFEQMAGLLDG